MTNKKFTTEQAEEQKLCSIREALGMSGSLELTNDFVYLQCGLNVQDQLLRLSTAHRRAYALDGCIGDGTMRGSTNTGCGATENDIVIQVGEIEIQFVGSPEDYFEEPEEWTIEDDLAYLYVGGAAVFAIDVDGLRETIDDMLDNN